MKRVNNLYDDMCSYENLKEIYKTIKCKCKNYNNLTKFDVYDNNMDSIIGCRQLCFGILDLKCSCFFID